MWLGGHGIGHVCYYASGVAVVVVVVVEIVFTLNCCFYPTTSALHPVSVLILHPTGSQRHISAKNYVVTD